MNSLVDDLLQELEFVIYMEYMLPPITICTNGHNICHSCKPNLEDCPTCRGNLLDTRTRPMEKLSNRITHPCNYRNSRCTAECLVDFKEQNENNCLFTPQRCPIAIVKKCNWVGPFSDLEQHINDIDHFVYPIEEQNLIICKPKMEHRLVYEGFVFIFGEIFFIYSEQLSDFLHVLIMFVGSKEQAKNFKYKIRMKTTDDQCMAACFTCRSYLEVLETPVRCFDFRSPVFHTNFWYDSSKWRKSTSIYFRGYEINVI